MQYTGLVRFLKISVLLRFGSSRERERAGIWCDAKEEGFRVLHVHIRVESLKLDRAWKNLERRLDRAEDISYSGAGDHSSSWRADRASRIKSLVPIRHEEPREAGLICSSRDLRRSGEGDGFVLHPAG